MNPYFVQARSFAGDAHGRPVLFTNLSSQQMTPGTLADFFARQDASRMPFESNEIERADQQCQGYLHLLSEDANVGNLPRVDRSHEFFSYHNPRTRRVSFRTSGQRAWNVPVQLLELSSEDVV
jgi:hypothetical protein